MGISRLLLDLDVFDASELLDLGGDKDQLDGQHYVVKADFLQVLMVGFFVALSGEIGDKERLIFDFGAEKCDFGDFVKEVNLNQRDKSILTSVKAELDCKEGIELDQGELFGRG